MCNEPCRDLCIDKEKYYLWSNQPGQGRSVGDCISACGCASPYA